MRYSNETAVPANGITERVQAGDLAVTLEEALSHCKVDAGLEDDYVTSIIRSVQDELEPPNGWLGRALTTATYRLVLGGFARRIKLAGAPIQSITSITYRDSSGDVQTVDPSIYRLSDGAIPSVVLSEGKVWPQEVECVPDAVSITYEAGFGDSSDVPEAIKQYIKIMTAYRYDVRKPVIVGTIATPSPYVRDMLESWRVRL